MNYTASRICKFLLTISTLTACGVQSPHVSNQASPTYTLPAVITTVVPSNTPTTPETPTPTPNLHATSQAAESTIQAMIAAKSAQKTQTAHVNMSARETQSAQEEMEAQIEAWYQNAGVSIVEDERIVNGELIKYYLSEKMYGYAKIGHIKQIDFRELEKIRAPYDFARLAGAARLFFDDPQFTYIDSLLKENRNGLPYEPWIDYGSKILPRIKSGNLFIPITTSNLNGEIIEAQINKLVFTFVDKKEFDTLLANMPLTAIYQKFTTLSSAEEPGKYSGGIVFIHGHTIYTTSYNIGYPPSGDNVNQLLADFDVREKYWGLQYLATNSNTAMLQSLFLPAARSINGYSVLKNYYAGQNLCYTEGKTRKWVEYCQRLSNLIFIR